MLSVLPESRNHVLPVLLFTRLVEGEAIEKLSKYLIMGSTEEDLQRHLKVGWIHSDCVFQHHSGLRGKVLCSLPTFLFPAVKVKWGRA